MSKQRTGQLHRTCAACAVLLFTVSVFGAALTGRETAMVARATVTQQSINEKEKQIKNARNERQTMNSNLTDMKKVKNALEQDRSDLDTYVRNLDSQLSEIQKKIDTLKEQIAQKEEEITQTEQELEEAIAVQEHQYESMKQRIKFMYEKGDTLALEMLIESGSFAEMLNKTQYIIQLSEYDRGKLDEYTQTVQYVTLVREQLTEEKKTLDEAKAAQETEEANMKTLIAQKQKEIAHLTANIQSQEQSIAQYDASIAQLDAEIKELERIVAAEKARLAEQNRQARIYDGGMFTWPAPSYTRITSEFGYRIHPIYGVNRFHSGIDMAAPGGSPILAAYGGTVVAASYSRSMGNYVMVDHGSGLYTVYMHASALYVSNGQSVTKGQKIAAVGTTGDSTGNHLHFSVRKDGQYVNPWGYLRG